MDDDVYEDYLSKFYELQRPSSIDEEDFLTILKLIFRNQSPYFRSLYKRKGKDSATSGCSAINLQKCMAFT